MKHDLALGVLRVLKGSYGDGTCIGVISDWAMAAFIQRQGLDTGSLLSEFLYSL